MVKVREHHPLEELDEINIPQWVASLCQRYQLADSNLEALTGAADFARDALLEEADENNVWSLNVSCFQTGLEMAEILAGFGLDTTGLQASVLYRCVREGRIPLDVVRRKFGGEVAGLIDKVQRMAVISTLRNDQDGAVFGVAGQQSAKIRQMLVSMIDDVRVPLIKIAERTCAIRAVKNESVEKQVRVARELFDVYAPLAHRLGLGNLKWELEDLAFRYLEPEDYKAIAKLLSEKRLDRQNYIKDVVAALEARLQEEGIKGEVYGRAKHIYSIWRKMQRKDVGFSQVYDIRAVRVLVPTITDCYAVLDWVHSQWRGIPKEYDDYIARPKENGYRSLHTAVIGPENKVLEIQIRTFAMHEEAELGVCAHWRYKGSEAKSGARSYEEKIEWMRQVLEWQEELEESQPASGDKVNADRVYVFTPEGHVVDLPVGATPLDFAYHIHTDIGHRCRGAKINGRMVPLNSELKTGDQVSIIAARHGEPSRDWLSSSMGYLKSNRARSKVLYWFRKQSESQNIVEGKKLLDRELSRLGIDSFDVARLAERFNKQGAEGIYAAIGAGDLGVEQVINAGQSHLLKKRVPDKITQSRAAPVKKVGASDVYISGVGNLMTQIAKCCKPVPGDSIGGYITQGRGVSIHRSDCGNFLRLAATDPQREIRVEWGSSPKESYRVKVRLRIYDRSGLLFDIAKIADRLKMNIASIVSGETPGNHAMQEETMDLLIDVEDVAQLSSALAQFSQIPNVIDARRINE